MSKSVKAGGAVVVSRGAEIVDLRMQDNVLQHIDKPTMQNDGIRTIYARRYILPASVRPAVSIYLPGTVLLTFSYGLRNTLLYSLLWPIRRRTRNWKDTIPYTVQATTTYTLPQRSLPRTVRSTVRY